jgi:hypothetical protein
MSRKGRWVLGIGLAVALAFVLGLVVSSRDREPSTLDHPRTVVSHETLGMDRGTSYYFETLKSAHWRQTFGYHYAEDAYSVDKCVDAIVRLGTSVYRRLEGQAQVVLLLSDVVAENPSSSVRAAAATSLANLSARAPSAPAILVPDPGDRLLAIMKELDGLHDENGVRRNDSPGTRQHVSNLVDELGRLEFDADDLLTSQNALKFFLTRPFILGEGDPTLRETFDRATARRMQSVVDGTLANASAGPIPSTPGSPGSTGR